MLSQSKNKSVKFSVVAAVDDRADWRNCLSPNVAPSRDYTAIIAVVTLPFVYSRLLPGELCDAYAGPRLCHHATVAVPCDFDVSGLCNVVV